MKAATLAREIGADVGRAAVNETLRMLRQNEVLTLTGLSRSTLYKLRREGRFPAPTFLAGSAALMRWRAIDVLSWIETEGKKQPQGGVAVGALKRA